MSILIGALEFLGPITDIDLLSDISGIYALLCENDGEYELIELGDCDYVREQVQAHPERKRFAEDGLDVAVAVHYTADLIAEERKELRQVLDSEFNDVEIAA